MGKRHYNKTRRPGPAPHQGVGERPRTAADQYVAKVMAREAREKRARSLNALDGYGNMSAKLGAYSPLLYNSVFLPNFITRDSEELTNAYRTNWLAKKIIDMPAEDMTRAWYSLSTSLPKKDIQDLKELEARHSVKQEITNAIRWGRLYGGSIAVMIIRDEEDRLDQPLDLDMLLPECFQGLLVLDRSAGIEPSLELVGDLDDPDFGLPEYYTVQIEGEDGYELMKIHHSRVLRFIGRELPKEETVRENYWGASELEHVWEELQRWESTMSNIAELVFQANVTTLKSDDIIATMATGTLEAQENVLKAIALDNEIRSSHGVQLLGSNDEMQNLPYNFAGLPDIGEQYMMNMAGAAEIPATKLFGRSPAGENATGESDLQNYYEMIASLQERMLRPALEKLLPVMAISCWGYVPKDLQIVFEPVRTMSTTEKMELADRHCQIVERAVRIGAISIEQAQAELKAWSERTEVFTKL